MNADWMKDIRVGDVLVSGKGTFRIVRTVKQKGDGCIVSFVIRRCSWTHRPYTVMFPADLKTQEYKPTGIRVTLKGEFDRIMDEEMNRGGDPPLLTCCDVIGIP